MGTLWKEGLYGLFGTGSGQRCVTEKRQIRDGHTHTAAAHTGLIHCCTVQTLWQLSSVHFQQLLVGLHAKLFLSGAAHKYTRHSSAPQIPVTHSSQSHDLHMTPLRGMHAVATHTRAAVCDCCGAVRRRKLNRDARPGREKKEEPATRATTSNNCPDQTHTHTHICTQAGTA